MSRFTLTTIALAAALLAAPAWAHDASASPDTAAAGKVQEAGWWFALGDPALSRLIESALDANLDIRQAHARLERSRALLQGTNAAFGPTGTAAFDGHRAKGGDSQARAGRTGNGRTSKRDRSLQEGPTELRWLHDTSAVDLHGAGDSARGMVSGPAVAVLRSATGAVERPGHTRIVRIERRRDSREIVGRASAL